MGEALPESKHISVPRRVTYSIGVIRNTIYCLIKTL